MSGHHEGEAWGLEVCPEANSIFTVGDDNKIMQFNYNERKFVSKGTLAKKASKKEHPKSTASTLSKYPPN